MLKWITEPCPLTGRKDEAATDRTPGKECNCSQRVLVEIHVAVGIGRGGSRRRHGQIGDKDVIVGEAQAHCGKAIQTAHKQPGAHQQQKRQRNLRHHERVAQSLCLFADGAALALIQNRAQICEPHVASRSDSEEDACADRQEPP